jgi:hypothetical protein
VTPPLPDKPTGDGSQMTGSNVAMNVYMPRWVDDYDIDTMSVASIAHGDMPGPLNSYNELVSNTEAMGAYDSLSASAKATLDAIAKAQDYRSTGRSLWEKTVGASAYLSQHGVYKTPWQLIQEGGLDAAPGSKSGGGGGGSGAAAPTPADPSAIRRAMDQVSTGLLGRTLSDKEFDKYYGSYTSAFSGNPDMDPTQHMIESARTDGDYEEYQVATKFTGALDKVLRGSA